jgi:hypothetical protein
VVRKLHMISKMQGQTQCHSDSTHLPLQSDVFKYRRALVTARFLHHQGWQDFEEVQLCTCVFIYKEKVEDGEEHL